MDVFISQYVNSYVSKTTTPTNNAVQKVLSKANYDSKDVNYVASLVSKHRGEQKEKQIIYRALIAHFRMEKGLAIYRLIKPILS